MERKGIALAGNILTDNVKMVGEYPQKGMLSTITEESLAVGGCVPNTAIDVKKVDPKMEIFAYGRVGNDDKGRYVLGEMSKVGIDVTGVKISNTAPTSYSDVITVSATGERTFFHNRGANKEFNPSDVDLDKVTAKMLHVGYIMLLDSFDKLNGETTPMAEFLKAARQKGIKTSIDLVSETSGSFHKIATAALPYCDYVIINEIEAGAIVGVTVRDDNGALIEENVKTAMHRLMDYGVNEKVIIHCPEKGYCLDKSGSFTVVNSLKLPKGFIKGSVGAGDAFCAGSLYAIYNEYSDQEILSFANLVAISCLTAADSVSGVCHKDKLKDLLK